MLPVLGVRYCMHTSITGLRARAWAFVLATAVLVAVLPSVTHDHPYLLSDNRHYAFYLWRRVFSRPAVTTCLAPVYVLALYCCAQRAGVWTRAF